MTRFLAILFGLLLGVAVVAQERQAEVHLDDGRVLLGTVVALDLTNLQLAVGSETVTIAAARIKSCRFIDPVSPPAAPTAEVVQGEPGPAAGTAAAAPPPPAGRRQAVASTGPIEDAVPVDSDEAALPHDVRGRSLLRRRLDALDEAYPWLAPAAPTQWVSLGLTLFVLMTLVVQLSTRVTGSEFATLGRSMGMSLWYLATALLQFAMVPSAHVWTAILLIGNTTLALFWLRNAFGLTRGVAVVAFAVQIGFVVLGYGTLFLVDAVLKSIGAPHA